MGRAAGALLACVCALHTSAAAAGEFSRREGAPRSDELVRTLVHRAVPRSPRVVLDAWGEPQRRAPLGANAFWISGGTTPERSLFPRMTESHALPDGTGKLALEYILNVPTARLTLRAGYRYGLPFDEVERPDDSVLIAAGGTLSISAGTVAWLQLDLQGFRELAGARLLRLDAVPGIRIRPTALPLEFGAGVLVSFAPTPEGLTFEQRLTKVIQLGATF